MKRVPALILLLFLSITQICFGIQSPDDFLGFPLGADRKLADYHQIVQYFKYLEKSSPKIKIEDLGNTTDNNDLIQAIISSEQNISQLEKYRDISQKLAHPAKINSSEAEQLIQQGKVVAFITCNIHSTEIGATQMAMEFAYQLITRTDPQVQFYLDNVILILMPSANPDGQIMVTDWYRQWVGTEYEGGRMPWLYHRYVGHDTNRDFFMLNQKESKLINKVMSQDWFPQVHLDEHQMGSGGPRMFVPPYKDPMSDNLSPILMRLEALYGTNMSFRLEEQGMGGVIDSYGFDSYWPGGTRTAAWKNIVSLLTEMASCNIATPIYIDDIELSGGRKGLAEYKQQVNFPNPWRGGWWRLRDIIDYELVASYSFLETSAKYREDILRAFYSMNLEAINKGKQESPYAFILPTDQHDPITAAKLVEILLEHGIEVYQTQQDLIHQGRIYRQGSIVIPLAQPLRSFIKEMMEVQVFPEIRLSSDGEPLYPYDVTSWSFPIQMGVNCEKIDQPFETDMKQILHPPFPKGETTGTSNYGYAISHQFNNTSIAVNRLLKSGVQALAASSKFQDNGINFEQGTIIIPQSGNIFPKLKKISDDLYLPIHALKQPLPEEKIEIKSVRVGLYKPWRASMDEGWTRWLLEQFEFDLISVHNDMIKKGELNKKLDVLIIVDIDKRTIIDPKPGDSRAARFYRPLPEKYEGGIGKEGVSHLKQFVKKGGTLITLDSGYRLPVDEFPLPVTNALENVSRSEYNAPGVMLKVNIDTDHPIGWGMPKTAAAFVSRSPGFVTSQPIGDVDRTVVARYPEEPLLISGWIKGEKLLQRKAAIVDFKFGKGKVILLGFRAQHRAQPHGTFKLLFNSIHYARLGD